MVWVCSGPFSCRIQNYNIIIVKSNVSIIFAKAAYILDLLYNILDPFV